jgi:hypothetical protein
MMGKTRSMLRKRRDARQLAEGHFQGNALEQSRKPRQPKPTSVFNKLMDHVLGPKDGLKIRK